MDTLITHDDEPEIVVTDIKAGDPRKTPPPTAAIPNGIGHHELPGRPLASVRSASRMAIAIAFFLTAILARASDRSPDLGIATGQTPYDCFFAPLRSVLGALGQNHPTSGEVSDLIREGRRFRFSYSQPYVPQMPAVTRSLHAGDCKAKSLWLASMMNDASLRFVVGKLTRGAKMSHAWLLWQNQGRWFILDPTMKSAAVALADTSENEWVPLFSYSAHGQFRHADARKTAASDRPEPGALFSTGLPLVALGK